MKTSKSKQWSADRNTRHRLHGVVIRARRKVWVNSLGTNPVSVTMLKVRNGSDWPFLIRDNTNKSQYWWAHVYPTQRAAISALGGRERARQKSIRVAVKADNDKVSYGA